MSGDGGRQWLHDLRNSINAICVTAAVVKRLLAEGKTEQARQFASELEEGCDRCRELMKEAPDDL